MTDCPMPTPYRVLVTGSRTWRHPDDITTILDAMLSAHPNHAGTPIHHGLVVVHGGAPGVDELAETWARTNHVRSEVHHAQWDIHGKAAGLRRNLEMARRGANICFAFIRDASKGASHCAAAAIAEDIFTVIIRDDEDHVDDGIVFRLEGHRRGVTIIRDGVYVE